MTTHLCLHERKRVALMQLFLLRRDAHVESQPNAVLLDCTETYTLFYGSKQERVKPVTKMHLKRRDSQGWIKNNRPKQRASTRAQARDQK